MTAWKKFKQFLKGVQMIFINYFALQVEYGWITIEQVPKRFRKKVQELLDLSHVGLDDADKA